MKKTMRLIGIAAFIAVMVFAFAACPSEPSDKAQTMTFRGSDSGGDYTLVITQDAANRAFTVKANDTYKLTYAGGRTSEGKVTEVSGADTFTLKPNDESKPAITAKVSGTNTLTALTPDEGTVIVWDGAGGETTAPGAAIESPKPTQPSTPSGGAITVTNQQLYYRDNETEEYTGNGKVYLEYWDYETDTLVRKDEIGSVTSGKLSFKLQAAPPASEFNATMEEFAGADGVTLTPQNAKFAWSPYFTFIDDNGNETYLFCESPGLFLQYTYADRNASITGGDDYTSFNNFNLKTGWNACYMLINTLINDVETITTVEPAGADQLKWVCAFYW